MEKKFNIGQTVKLTGGIQEMLVVEYELETKYISNALFGTIAKNTKELTGQVLCSWIENNEKKKRYFEEDDLEEC